MSAAIRTRRATPDDASALAQLGERTFRATFAQFNAPRDMDAYVSAAYGVEQQRREIADPERAYLLAEVDGALAGFALLHAGARPACDVGRGGGPPAGGVGERRVLADEHARDLDERRGVRGAQRELGSRHGVRAYR